MNYLHRFLRIFFSFVLCLSCTCCSQKPPEDEVREKELVQEAEEERSLICDIEEEIIPYPQEIILIAE